MKLYESFIDFLSDKKSNKSDLIQDWKPGLSPNQREILNKYISGEINLSKCVNFLHIMKDLFKDKELINLYKEEFPNETRLSKRNDDISFCLLLLISSLEIKDTEIIFGKGLRPGKFGEGKSRCWFFEDFGIKYMLFIDDRGSSIEIEKYDETFMKNLYYWLLKNTTDYYKSVLNL